eukprot:COSAG01_NODE_2397_length_7771_cov_12.578076_6_plen_56_part_00
MVENSYPVSWWTHLCVLFKRFVVDYLRDPTKFLQAIGACLHAQCRHAHRQTFIGR